MPIGIRTSKLGIVTAELSLSTIKVTSTLEDLIHVVKISENLFNLESKPEIDPHTDQKQEMNFTWPNGLTSTACM